ncbi:spermatogenesis-associated protein 1 [Pseudoliparis swirei]|uniref:spermatogenesis-associated protein 1 n=1 Tax=Pseudoliparis swirei TaxID=2059687 RepID=UPI0024BEFC03|nr:spermatogenesis-associated protein 1 [Pseudoliparis swirei]
MALCCESMRYPENRRPASRKFVELHVLFVPEDQWNVKLNKVPAEAIESFTSAGFIRVYPETTLKTLRSELGALLGPERHFERFSFLKCVGRSLALVKSKQEKDLKVKTFAPPYAPQPELYLLPTVEIDSSVCSQSLITDTSSSSPDHQTYNHPPETCTLPAGTKEPVKFPLIPQCSHKPPPTPSLEEEEEHEEQSYSSSEAEGEHEEEGLSSNQSQWADPGCCPRKPHIQRTTQLVSQNKGNITASQQREADSAQVKESPENKDKDTCKKKKQYQRQNRAPLEDRDSGFSLTDGLCKSKDVRALKSIRTKPTSAVTDRPVGLSRCVALASPPPGRAFPVATQKTTASPVFQTNREELIEEIKLVREERKKLEWTRQELLRKGKDLLSQNRHRRNQARDSWKKKYFETKKATAPLEENLRNLRQELETLYNKLLHQLQARDNRGKPWRQGRSSVKNELIIQIMTESHEIDNLKRKVEDSKMKLVTEIKLRKQAATELKALKAELAQKKSQSSRPGPTSSLCFGKTTRDRPQVQSTSI